MCTIKVVKGGKSNVISCKKGEKLLSVLNSNGYDIPAFCGGYGKCGKCGVKVNGRNTLSCEYFVENDITVYVEESKGVVNSLSGIAETGDFNGADCLALDIGTTSISLALYNPHTKEVAVVKTFDNPQKIYGADVISRIKSCSALGVGKVREVLVSELKKQIEDLAVVSGVNHFSKMTVSANSVMTHIFIGADCSGLGVSPYKMAFSEKQIFAGSEISLPLVEQIETLPLLHAFFGGDVLSGLTLVEIPDKGKVNAFIDLGTNAEIAVITDEKIYCTSSSAGPCFEGANITCGMSAKEGAIFDFKIDKGVVEAKAVGGVAPVGICGTGLIDSVAELLRCFIIDKNGTFTENDEFEICEKIVVTQEDIRAFQSAKSAVRTALEILLVKSGYSLSCIDKLYISGGFAAFLNVENAKKTGLIPSDTKNIITFCNTSLSGIIKNKDVEEIVRKCEYVDLTGDSDFQKRFIENMTF